jgi:hypothetical protein
MRETHHLLVKTSSLIVTDQQTGREIDVEEVRVE